MTKTVDKINLEILCKAIEKATKSSTAAYTRTQRAAIFSSFSVLNNELNLGLDLDFLLDDKRVGSRVSGRPIEPYVAYWPLRNTVVVDSIPSIAYIIGCSPQVLYKHLRKATEKGENLFIKKIPGLNEYVEIHIISEGNTEEDIRKSIESRHSELVTKSKEKYNFHNEDGSY